ncbi:MAG: hypothetical protein ABI353_19325 [Isosphaeraceae bacterium]
MPGTAPLVMSSRTFMTQTSPLSLIGRGRGKRLKAIGLALDHWNDGNLPPGQRIGALLLIVEFCHNWLRAKNNKGKDGMTTGFRRPTINKLANQAFARAQYEKFEANKSANANGNVLGSGRSLQGGYQKERSTYLASGKTKAVSGSTGHFLAHHTQTPSGAANFALGNGTTPTVGLDFDTMTDQQFKDLVTVFGPPNRFESEVLFLDKQTRLKHLILIENRLMYDGASSLYDTSSNPGGMAYAIDLYGNLFSVDDRKSSVGVTNNKRFNHSTYNAGKDVICAGIIKVNQGVLTYIDNESGHYKPTRKNLQDAVLLLQNLGVNLANVQVNCKTQSAAHHGKLAYHIHNNGSLFASNPARRPDSLQDA